MAQQAVGAVDADDGAHVLAPALHRDGQIEVGGALAVAVGAAVEGPAAAQGFGQTVLLGRVQAFPGHPLGGLEGRHPLHLALGVHPQHHRQFRIVGQVLGGADLEILVVEHAVGQVAAQLDEEILVGGEVQAQGLVGPLHVPLHHGAALVRIPLVDVAHQGKHGEGEEDDGQVGDEPVPPAPGNGGFIRQGGRFGAVRHGAGRQFGSQSSLPVQAPGHWCLP